MNISEQFKKHFSEDNLKRIFTEHIIYSGATGIDNLDQYAFRRLLNEQVEILSRKMLAGTYQFTKYKLKLISKGRGKIPREIAIPTVRDRIAMRAMCNFLNERFNSGLSVELPQYVIKRVRDDIESGKYTGFIKLDVSNFYPSIIHDELKSRLRKRIKSDEIIDVLFSAIRSPTVITSKPSDQPATLGVPQGLAISNILASIYLLNIDRHMKSQENISYYRYVDDILVFCDIEKAHEIANEIISRFKRIGLRIHNPATTPEKSKIDRISQGFDYLGYQISGSRISVRASSVEKIKDSLAAIFTSYKHSKNKSQEFLLWRLNLRITGCIFEKKSKGWLFFFSQINDESLLHGLDHYVKKLANRFSVSINQKLFSRSLKEITHKKHETNYIPNFDKYSTEQKKETLTKYFNLNVENLSDDEVSFEFHKRIGKQVKDLLEDVKDFS